MGKYMNFDSYTSREFLTKYDRDNSGELDTKEILYNALSEDCTNESGCMARAHDLLNYFDDSYPKDQRLTRNDLSNMF